MIILQDMSMTELSEYLTTEFGVRPFVAGQVYSWLQKNVGFDDMSNISLALRAALADKCIAAAVQIVETLESAVDGTRKFLFRLTDGNVVEGVLMRYKYGNTLCISTQVGCRMGCKFCASTLGGLVRNLSAGEILSEVLAVNALETEPRYVTNVVLMGSGEPLDNFDQVVKFLQLVSDPQGIGISLRNISLSTCGIVPNMIRLADMGLPVNLTLSLHDPFNDERALIMPVTNAYPVEEAVSACKYFFDKTGRRIYIEYTLIDGQNDSYAHAMKLALLLHGMPVHVNVISLNPVRETGLKGTSESNLKRFLGYLTKLGVSATRRRTMGRDIEGACGQLRRRYLEEHHD